MRVMVIIMILSGKRGGTTSGGSVATGTSPLLRWHTVPWTQVSQLMFGRWPTVTNC